MTSIKNSFVIIKNLFILIILFIQFACSQPADSIKTWQSKNRDLSFKYSTPWELVPVLDIKKQTMVGVIDQSDGKSYIIQYFDDVPTYRLSTQQYLNGIKKTMLQPNPKNNLLLEDSLVFHNHITYRQVYLMYTEKWGLLKQYQYVIRTGKEMITVQILFPTTESAAKHQDIPQQLLDFDKSVKLNGQ